jgi:hypothetical protein
MEGDMSMDKIDVTPQSWDELYVNQRGSIRCAVYLHLAAHASAITGKLGAALGKVHSVEHGEHGMTMHLDQGHGENLEALRDALLDRFNCPGLEREVRAVVDSRISVIERCHVGR